jgi:hypothetical protein
VNIREPGSKKMLYALLLVFLLAGHGFSEGFRSDNASDLERLQVCDASDLSAPNNFMKNHVN